MDPPDKLTSGLRGGPDPPTPGISASAWDVGGGGDGGPGEMDVVRVNYVIPGRARVSPLVLGLFHTPPANSGHTLPGGGGDSRSSSYPLDDVHQARIA